MSSGELASTVERIGAGDEEKREDERGIEKNLQVP